MENRMMKQDGGSNLLPVNRTGFEEHPDCKNCYACQKGFGGKGKKGEVYYIITEACNLHCKYCYEGRADKYCSNIADTGKADEKLSMEVIKLAELLKIPSIGFFGGEPMLEWDLIKWTVKQAKKEKRNVHFGMTTNGTLLTEDKILFCKGYGVHITLSVDGVKEIHDANRIYADGRGSFDDIPLEMIGQIMPELVNIRMTFAPGSDKYILDSYKMFRDYGFKSLIIEPVYSDDWDMGDFRRLYEKLLAEYFEDEESGKKINLTFVQKFIENLSVPVKQEVSGDQGRCGGVIAVSPNGDLTPCQRYAVNKVSHDKFKFANVWDEDLREKGELVEKLILREFKKSRIKVGNLIQPEGADCAYCVNSQTCFGGCHAGAYEACGDSNKIQPIYCKIQKALWETFLKMFYINKRLMFRPYGADNNKQTQGGGQCRGR